MKLIAFEGLPGSGKTCLSKKVSKSLGICRVGEILDPQENEILPADVPNPSLEYFIDSDERKYLLSERLLAKTSVLMDRSYLSTIAYSLCEEDTGIASRALKWKIKFEQNFRQADLYIFLSLPAEKSLARKNKKKNNPHDLWSWIGNLEKTSAFYKRHLQDDPRINCYVIDASRPYLDVLATTERLVKYFL